MSSSLPEQLRNDVLTVLDAGIRAVDPHEAMLANLALQDDVLRIGPQTYPLDNIDRIVVVGGGKACTPMAAAVYEVLGDRLAAGSVNVKYGHTAAGGAWRLRYGRGGEPESRCRPAPPARSASSRRAIRSPMRPGWPARNRSRVAGRPHRTGPGRSC